MNWEVIIKWLPKLAQGATLTLELVAIAVIAGLLLAIPLGIARSSRLWSWLLLHPRNRSFRARRLRNS